MQFHPTVLWLGAGVKGQLTLVSEAVRGEGALLLDTDGVRFMPDVHPMAELAPRDVVAHAIVRRMAETGADHVWLDARHLGADFLRRRFPTINERLLEHGIDLTTDLVPVAPAQHYHSGGVVTDLVGRTSRARPVRRRRGRVHRRARRQPARVELAARGPGLRHARGPAHRRAGAAGRAAPLEPVERPGRRGAGRGRLARPGAADRVRRPGRRCARATGLRRAAAALAAVPTDAHLRTDEGRRLAAPQVAEWETTNVHQVATVLTATALEREESRGGHARSDFPATDPSWRVRLELSLDADGDLVSRRSRPRHSPEWIPTLSA